jgi:two-component system, cell cycle sensor histidine kinase and response regulator CckA
MNLLSSRQTLPAWLMILCAGAALALIVAGLLFFHYETQTLRLRKHDELQAIADLKADQIQKWRKGILSDARGGSATPFLRQTLKRILSAPDDPEAVADLRNLLALIQENQDYETLLLSAPDGRLIISLDPRITELEPATRLLAERAIAARSAILGDLTRTEPDRPLHIDAAAPVWDDSRQTMAVLVLRSDPQDYLFPLIQSWPNSSSSAETLLVRPDEGQVLYLNTLRHRADTALTLRLPVTRADLPAARAVAGESGIFKGRDYRGVEVLSVLQAVPGSDWFMVAKVDLREMLAELRFRGGAILVLIVLGIVLTGLMAALVHRRRQQGLYRELYHAERRRREAQEEIRATFYGIGDGVIATDAHGRVTRLNRVAEQLTGWPENEALGQPLETVFQIVNEQSRQPVNNPVARVLREGAVAGLANHTLLLARDGAEYPIADSGAPIRDERGAIIGVVLVFRDQTPERTAEATLRESEGRYRRLFDANPQPLWVYDFETLKFLNVNDAAVAHYGYSREEFLAMTIADIRPEEDVPEFLQHLRCELPDGLKSGGISRHRKKDGSLIDVEIASHTFNMDGRRARLVLATDVTERRRTEAALRSSEENYRQLFEAESDAIVLVDNTTGRILQANTAAGALYGYSRDELLTMVNTDLSAEPQLTRKVTTETPLEPDQVVSVSFRRHRKKDGTIFPVEMTGRFFIRDGRPVHIAAIRDITRRTQSEAALRESEERLRLALAAADQGLYDLNLLTGEAAVSDEYARMLGYEPDEFKETNAAWFERLHPDDHEATQAVFRDYVEGRISEYRVVFRQRTRDGRWKWILSQGKIMQRDDQGRPVRMLGTHTDITEQRNLEEQLLQAQKMESVGRLAGGIAHDFNNMLGVIIGHSELALDQVVAEQPLYANLREIRKAAQRSADLTRQLLAFARKQTISPKVLDINQTVAGMLTMLQRLIGEDIQLSWKPGQDLWSVKVDPAQIDQILANLAVNARDAIAGTGRLTIETANAVLDESYCRNHIGFRPGEYIRLAVSDNGCGMTREVQAHLFEPFFTTKEVGKGTGLGLATIYGIVKQNNGFINAYSEPGRGTTFTLYLPRVPAAAQPAAQPADPQQELGGSETILLVEDEESVLDLGRDILRRCGYTVLTAGTPQAALALARAHTGPLHLLLTDVVMPHMNGQELKEHIAALYPDSKTLFMSGYTAEMIGQHGILNTRMHFLQKPFTVDALARSVRTVLDQA